MFYIPIWITNVLLLMSAGFAGFQHSRLNRENPFATIQFGIIVFAIVMVVVVVLATHAYPNPWMSLVFFLIAAATFWLTVRQFRMLPPRKAFE
jgi:uncharacterized protein involved in response to NO